MQTMPRNKLRRLTTAAMMGVVAFVLLSVNFSIPVINPFAEFDAAALPELIGGFILGPVGAIQIIVVKLALKLLLVGTESMYTGELSNLMLSLAFVLPAVLYYRRDHSKHGAVIGLIIGSVCKVVLGVFTNLYIIYPFYISAYGMNWEGLVEICGELNPWITDVPTLVALSIVPFNIISTAVSSVITVLVYKKISVPVKKFIQ